MRKINQAMANDKMRSIRLGDINEDIHIITSRYDDQDKNDTRNPLVTKRGGLDEDTQRKFVMEKLMQRHSIEEIRNEMSSIDRRFYGDEMSVRFSQYSKICDEVYAEYLKEK